MTIGSAALGSNQTGEITEKHHHAACVRELFEPLTRLQQSGGPRPHQYQDLERWIWRVAAHLKVGHITREEIDAQINALGTRYLWGTLIGFGFLRPHGYSGDFEIIDRIYRTVVSDDPGCQYWDTYFHQLAAPRAVRNRKRYFKELLVQHSRLSSEVTVLNLGSGPCRDVAEYLDTHPESNIEVTCVDQDPDAIRYARRVCAQHLSRLTFVRANVLRYRPTRRYSLVWCAGVADYLSDDLCVLLLRRSLMATAPGGEVVVGNFSDNNPTRDHMEVLGRWYLQHRSQDELFRLGARACGEPRRVRVDSEATGVNLFLRIQQAPVSVSGSISAGKHCRNRGKLESVS